MMFSHISEENGKNDHIIGIMTIKMFPLRQKMNLRNGLKAVHSISFGQDVNMNFLLLNGLLVDGN